MSDHTEHHDRLRKKMEEAEKLLGDVFDNVLIICEASNVAGDGLSTMVKGGTGSSYARYGMAKEWMMEWERIPTEQTEED